MAAKSEFNFEYREDLEVRQCAARLKLIDLIKKSAILAGTFR